VSAAPIIKWAGGKRQLLPVILPRLPQRIRTYYEPFAGGAAVFFALAKAGRFQRAVLGDANADLTNIYICVRDEPAAVLAELRKHAKANSEKHFYAQRPLMIGDYSVRGAARFIYLNRTCFNGLFRVNKAGEFNVSWGKYAAPRIADVDGIERASSALQGVEIVNGDFSVSVMAAGRGDAVYFDPPYLAATKSASFQAFHKDGFGVDDQERLASVMLTCAAVGARVLLSNSDTLESRRIYGVPGNTVEVVGARRNINSDAAKRGAVGEILVSVPVLEVKRRRAA
jgi:DNA adenine methylase